MYQQSSGAGTSGNRPSGRPKTIKIPDNETAYIATTEEEWDVSYKALMDAMGSTNVLGLDVEYLLEGDVPIPDSSHPHDSIRLRNINAGRDPLLQLGAPGVAVLIRLCYFERLPRTLVDLLADRTIIKIVEDACRLAAQWRLRCVCCLDLRHVCVGLTRFNENYHYSKFNLKSIGNFLGESIEYTEGAGGGSGGRDWKIACSNWASPNLNFKQVVYAAKDAIAAAGSYLRLIRDFADATPAFEPDSEEFHAYFREKFRRFFNRPFSDIAADKLTKKRNTIKHSGGAKGGSSLDNGSVVDNAIGGKDPDKMKPKAFRKLAEKMCCSDSDLDIDYEEELSKCLEQQKETKLDLVTFNDSTSGEPMAMIERELLDWAIAARVPSLKATTQIKQADGTKRRYGVTIEIEKVAKA